jgi:ABC-type dipeptide/oligopeptide/nickel transport system permease subunit
LSRLIFGARVSLIVGVMGTLVAGSIGTGLGILAGYLGGWVDQVIMRLTDAWLALPALVFAIFLATMLGPSMWNIVIILGRSTGRATPASSAAKYSVCANASLSNWLRSPEVHARG